MRIFEFSHLPLFLFCLIHLLWPNAFMRSQCSVYVYVACSAVAGVCACVFVNTSLTWGVQPLFNLHNDKI